MPRRLTRIPRQADEYDEPRRQPPQARSDRRESDDGTEDHSVATGWEGWRRTKANAPSRGGRFFKIHDEESLIMFQEDGPYASFLMHWCDWVPKGHKMSYICSQNDCPLDEVDPSPGARVRFNIVDLSGDIPVVRVFECGATVTDTLARYAGDEGLSGRYFAIQMVGEKTRRTQLRPVKLRDVKDDWQMEPLTEDQIDKLANQMQDDTTLDRPTRKELQEVADMASQ